MHRFYLPPENCNGNAIRLDGREAHHALHVLRLKCGDEIVVLDGAGNEFFCEVEKITRDSISLRVTKKIPVPALPCSITLLVAIPKGKIIESIIQKSVELGARRIVPLLTERVVTQLDNESAESKREKWRQVAIEAIKQCGAAWLPEIETPVTIEKFLARKEPFDLSLVGSLQKERRHPREVFHKFEKNNGQLPKNAAVWIGPEGDFTLDELRAIENSGAHPISLGNLTLRVETAAIYCLSILNYELQRD
ncbi:MAG TPA: RsmE family RNA methyltransferase [Verrucomicrobiae bacterium]|nr:RsmE family RNA methyltransferase [Verrucomicrobiae bacterium]